MCNHSASIRNKGIYRHKTRASVVEVKHADSVAAPPGERDRVVEFLRGYGDDAGEASDAAGDVSGGDETPAEGEK